MAQEQGKALVQTAVTRRARPRRVAAYARCAHRDPDLLERAPVIRRALVAEEPAAVGALEREIHLEAAPVRAARIGPAALVAVDAEPAPKRGWVIRTPPGPVRAVPPVAGDLPEPSERVDGERARDARRRATLHDRLPVPRIRAETADVVPPGGCLPHLPAR